MTYRIPSGSHMVEPCEPALDAASCNIPGLGLIADFVSVEEELQLLAAVQAGPWDHLAKRRVQHYGFPFDYIVSAFHLLVAALVRFGPPSRFSSSSLIL
jgi:hypothetical protein